MEVLEFKREHIIFGYKRGNANNFCPTRGKRKIFIKKLSDFSPLRVLLKSPQNSSSWTF